MGLEMGQFVDLPFSMLTVICLGQARKSVILHQWRCPGRGGEGGRGGAILRSFRADGRTAERGGGQ